MSAGNRLHLLPPLASVSLRLRSIPHCTQSEQSLAKIKKKKESEGNFKF